MQDLVKKLEEQISFLQNEISQMSGELYSQQKEIKVLKKEGPLTTDELTKKISKYRKFRGETPNRTISAILNRSIHVKYVGNGRYDIIPKTL